MSRTAKVKIALSINSDGEWVAYGFKGCEDWAEAMEAFDPIDNEQRRWVVVDVALPDTEPEAVSGAVVEVEG